MLFPFLPFDVIETPLSYARRLARYHADKPVIPFLHDMKIRPEWLASGEVDALSRLADISGTPLQDLCRNVAVRNGTRSYELRGEFVTAEFLSNPYTAFCPACLAEDDQAGERLGRWEWTLTVSRTCTRHEIPLILQAQAAWNDKFHDLNQRVPERGQQLRSMAAAAVRRPVSPLQNYVFRRLEGKTGPSWLDAQSLEQASRATELLGALLRFGAEQNLNELSQDDWDHAGRVGFERTSLGEAGIRPVLQSQFTKFDDTSGTPRARKIFGFFYNALAHSKSRKDAGDISRILREVIIENVAIAGGERVLGGVLSDRRLHTVASLAKEQGLDRRTLRSVLVAAKVIPSKAAAHFPIPVEQGREVASRVQRTVHVISLPKFLNCARPLVDQLFTDRLLTPIYAVGLGNVGRTLKSVDKEEIAVLLAKLQAKAKKIETSSNGLVSISKAAEKAKVPAVVVVHLILAGFLDRVDYLCTETGIGALMVDPEEVKLKKMALAVGLSAMEAFASLKIPKEAGWLLVDECQKTAGLVARDVVGPDQNYRIKRFPFESVARFKADFTTPARLAEQHQMQIGEVVRRLKKSGAQPKISSAEVGIDFYKVSDLPSEILI